MVLIVLGAIKAAKIARDELKKDSIRNGVIGRMDGPGERQSDWWGSSMAYSDGLSDDAKSTHNIGAWSRQSRAPTSPSVSAASVMSGASAVSAVSAPSPRPSSSSSSSVGSSNIPKVSEHDHETDSVEDTVAAIADISELSVSDTHRKTTSIDCSASLVDRASSAYPKPFASSASISTAPTHTPGSFDAAFATRAATQTNLQNSFADHSNAANEASVSDGSIMVVGSATKRTFVKPNGPSKAPATTSTAKSNASKLNTRSAVSAVDTRRRFARPATLPTGPPGRVATDELSSTSSPAAQQTSSLYAQGTMKRQPRKPRIDQTTLVVRTALDEPITGQVSARTSNSSLAAPGALKKRVGRPNGSRL